MSFSLKIISFITVFFKYLNLIDQEGIRSRGDTAKERLKELQASSRQVRGQEWRRGVKNRRFNEILSPNNCSRPTPHSTPCSFLSISEQGDGLQIFKQRTFLFKNYLNYLGRVSLSGWVMGLPERGPLHSVSRGTLPTLSPDHWSIISFLASEQNCIFNLSDLFFLLFWASVFYL